jgi:hypothetical protein
VSGLKAGVCRLGAKARGERSPSREVWLRQEAADRTVPQAWAVRAVVQWIVTRVLRTALIAFLLCALAACHRHSPTSVPTSAPGDPALSIAGDPESASGATWTLVGTLGGTSVDLQGILLKPRGRGPFPAVVLSHGAGSNAQSYGRALGSVMRTWGLVCIAVNYTHARGAPPGAPGTLLQQGASTANAFRAHATVIVLARLRFVDVRRVAAHGHSMGAFVTTAFVAAPIPPTSAWRHTRPAVSCWMPSTTRACQPRASRRRGASRRRISGTAPGPLVSRQGSSPWPG